MKVKITASRGSQSSEGACSVSQTHELKDEGDLSKAVKVVIDDFRSQCGSIYDMTIKVTH